MCTGVRLIAENGAVVAGRTLEFAREIASDIVIIPRNYTFKGTAPTGKPDGLSWQTHYAVVGANAEKLIGVIDGVNEKGLAGGLFYFTGYAGYQECGQNEYNKSIAPWELLTLLLTTCQSVDEVKKVLPTIKVTNTPFAAWGIVPPLHAIVHDAQGNSLVIEYVNGQLTTFDNPIGVITNAPTFDWHLTNLKNFITITPMNKEEVSLKGFKMTALGQGSGMIGLPGDFTSPSRFVRAVAFSQSVVNLKTQDDTRRELFHVLNLFDIPMGVVREKLNGNIFYDHTQWTSAYDLKNNNYFWRTYNNHQIYNVDLNKYDLNAKETKVIPMENEEIVCSKKS